MLAARGWGPLGRVAHGLRRVFHPLAPLLHTMVAVGRRCGAVTLSLQPKASIPLEEAYAVGTTV